MKLLAIKLTVALLTFVIGVATFSILVTKPKPAAPATTTHVTAEPPAPPSDVRSDPVTVLDYYLLLPDAYFEADREQRVKWMLDEKRGGVVDQSNGYLVAQGDGAQMTIYLRLFQRKNARPIAAVASCEDSLEPNHLDFYEYKHGYLELADSMPSFTPDDGFTFKLSRFGNVIEVFNGHGARTRDLLWNGAQFKSLRKRS